MIMMQQLILACWIIFLLYWMISATAVKPIQETRGWLGGNWYPILLLFGFLFMINFRFLARLGIPVDLLARLLIPHSIVTNAVAATLLIAGLMIAIIARRTLAKNWSVAVALKQDHELITTGLYRYVRHPIYTGMLLMLLGTTVSLSILGACIGFLIFVLTIWLKLRQEEALLMEHFSQKYLVYKKRTKTLIPFIW
jgi:protein-S-isoprenylcysteine O-methyltransferase Ste14